MSIANKLRYTLTCMLLLLCGSMQAQNNPKITSDALIYDFGTFEEAKGNVSHVFKIKNTGEIGRAHV